jgi:hypothetical protein
MTTTHVIVISVGRNSIREEEAECRPLYSKKNTLKKKGREEAECCLLHRKKTHLKKKEEKGSYLQVPTFATTLKLLLPSHS